MNQMYGFKVGDKVRCIYYPNVTGTVMGPSIPPTPSPSVMVKVDHAVLDMEAGDTDSIALTELEKI